MKLKPGINRHEAEKVLNVTKLCYELLGHVENYTSCIAKELSARQVDRILSIQRRLKIELEDMSEEAIARIGLIES